MLLTFSIFHSIQLLKIRSINRPMKVSTEKDINDAFDEEHFEYIIHIYETKSCLSEKHDPPC